MRTSDKLLSELDSWSSRNGPKAGPNELERLRGLVFAPLSAYPEDLLSEVFMSFLDRYRRDGQAAVEWLGKVASLLMGEYDGLGLDDEDWSWLRELVSANAGYIPLETLTDLMSQVLDHGAL